MKDFKLLFFLILSLVCLTGFNYNKVSISNEESRINPKYLEYENLSSKEKEKVAVIPVKNLTSSIVIKENNNIFSKAKSSIVARTIPTSYDLRNVNGVSFVNGTKDQSTLGLCWTFSTITSLESFMLKKGMGTFDFSERQMDYAIAEKSNITENYNPYAIGELGNGGNNIYVSELWLDAVSPINESIMPYDATDMTKKSVSKVFNDKNIKYDITSSTIFPALDMGNLRTYYASDFVTFKEDLNAYNQTIKNHIMNNGALSVLIYFYEGFITENGNEISLLYNDGSVDYGYYYDTAHAVSIIGWNDNYGDINGDGVGDGAWLVKNSWGKNYEFFYVSYFDEDIVTNMMGVNEVKTKSWDNSYGKISDVSRLYDYNGNKVETTFIFSKNYSDENLEFIKISPEFGYNTFDESADIYVSTTGDLNSFTKVGTVNIHDGINTLDNTNIILPDSKFALRVVANSFVDLSVFTTDINETVDEILGVNKNSDKLVNSENSRISFDVFTKNFVSGTKLSVDVQNDENVSILSSFNKTNCIVTNGYCTFDITLLSTLSDDYNSVNVVLSSGTAKNSVSVPMLKFKGNGTEAEPYLIETAEDLNSIRNNLSAFYKLKNSIDLSYVTNNQDGLYYNSASGWTPIGELYDYCFSGSLDGNGYSIKGLKSTQGGLFECTNGAVIKNLKIEDFDVELVTDNYAGLLVNNNMVSTIKNVGIENSTLYAEVAGSVAGASYEGIIDNVYSNSIINGDYYAGGIVGYLGICELDDAITEVKHTYFNGTVYGYGDVYSSVDEYVGGIIGYIRYVDRENSIVDQILNVNYNYYYNNLIEKEDIVYPTKAIGYQKIEIDENVSSNQTAEININNTSNKTFEEMKLQTTYDNYDFTNIWSITSGNTPVLNVLVKPNTIPNISYSFNNYFEGIDSLEGLLLNIPTNVSIESFNDDEIALGENITYTLYNKDGSLFSGNYIGTNTMIEITNGYDVVRLNMIVKGDITGTGTIGIGDVAKLYQYLRGKISMSTPYILAGDTASDGNITINDVAKLYQFVRGKIDSLEEGER